MRRGGRRAPRDRGGRGGGAAQAVLSNARRHAPGCATELVLDWTEDAATLTGTTAVASRSSTGGSNAGGGRGLPGLRERVDALGGTADWAVHDGAFVVTARVPRVGAVHS